MRMHVFTISIIKIYVFGEITMIINRNLKMVYLNGAVSVTLKIPLNEIKLFLLKRIYISHISKTIPRKKMIGEAMSFH